MYGTDGDMTHPSEPEEALPREPEPMRPSEPEAMRPPASEETRPPEPEATPPSASGVVRPSEPGAMRPPASEAAPQPEPEAMRPPASDVVRPSEPGAMRPPESELEVPRPLVSGAADDAIAGALRGAARESTGDERVDAAIARLGELDGAPTASHPEIFQDVHRRLQEALTGIDGGQP